MIRGSLRFLALALLFGLAACASGPRLPEGMAALTVQASQMINPTDGTPEPVELHIYQLRSADRLKNADFFQLSSNATATLGDDMLESDQHFIQPGETRQILYPMKPDVQYIGITAAFRDIDSATWRLVVPFARRVTVKIDGNTLSLPPKKAD